MHKTEILTEFSVAIFLTSFYGFYVLDFDGQCQFSNKLHFLSFIPFHYLIVCPNAIINLKALNWLCNYNNYSISSLYGSQKQRGVSLVCSKSIISLDSRSQFWKSVWSQCVSISFCPLLLYLDKTLKKILQLRGQWCL